MVLVVSEFDDLPHLCKRDFPNELQDGAIYVRPRGKPESRQPSLADMRDLLDLATTKGVREFVRRAGQAGIPLGEPRPQIEIDGEAYLAEAEAAWGAPTPVMEAILAAGHTSVSVRPTTYSNSRISRAALRKFITDNTVRMRGWPLPFVGDREGVIRFQDSIGQDIEPKVVPHIEAWRMCSSGQFLHRRVLSGDVRDIPEARPADPASSGVVIVWDVLLYLVELAEFGARLAASLDQDAITFDVCIDQIAGRELVSGDWQRELHGPYTMSANTLVTSLNVSATRLAVEPRAVGVELSQSLLTQFGLDVPDRVLDDWQAQVFNR